MSTTKNIGLFKHDNVETNTNMFDIEKALNSNWDKTDEAIGKDRERLNLLEASNTIYNYKGKVETFAELQNKTKTKGDVWYCTEKSTYYASNGTDWIPTNLNLKLGVIDEIKSKAIKCMQEIETPTPVIGTDIDISDSAEAKITELNIKGNSRQKTRNGKNLLELQEGTYTNNGITAVVKNGIITLNGTATETVPIYINLKTTVTALANILYTLSINNEKTIGDSNNFCALRINNDGQKQALLHNKNATYLQGNTTDTEITYITIRIASGTTFSNFEIKPQLELGNVASNWEQGGIAPGPDYHSEIESCGDNINLFDGEYYDGKGYNTNTGALETNANLYCNKNYINILGGQRKISLSKNGVGKNTRFFFYNSNKQYISTATGEKNVEIPENAIYLNFQITKSVIDNEMSNIKVEKGEPTSYSKNGQGLVNIKIGNENMLDIIENTYSENGITATVKEGIITLNGTATSTSFIYINLKTPITALANILYTLSTNNEKTIGDNNNYCAVRLNNDGQKQALLHNKNATYLQGNTTDTEITYITIRIASGTTLSNFIIKPKFERNNVATTYEKHQSQSYTIPVQEEMLEEDTFDLNNEEEVHTWDKYIITGDENWKKHNSTNNNSFYWEASGIITNILTPKNNDEKGIIKNTHFKSYDVNNIVFNNIIGSGLAVDIGFYITTGQNGISSVLDFKQWLKTQYEAGTPVTIYYKLAQEKRIAFTQEQKEIAKQIKNKAKTYKKITHINSTDKVSPNIEIIYKKDIEKVFNNIII